MCGYATDRIFQLLATIAHFVCFLFVFLVKFCRCVFAVYRSVANSGRRDRRGQVGELVRLGARSDRCPVGHHLGRLPHTDAGLRRRIKDRARVTSS